MSSCHQCTEKLGRADLKIQCSSTCKQFFHTKCVKISQEQFKQLEDEDKIKYWVCDLCKRDEQMMLFMKKQFKEVKDQMKALETSQDFISKKYDDLMIELKGVSEMKQQIKALEDVNMAKDREMRDMKERIHNLEQYSRKNNFEIGGIPQSANENIENIVIQVAKAFDVSLTPDDIQNAHRLKCAPGKIPNIIVKTVNNKKKEEILRKRRKTVTNGNISSGGTGKIYINEHLTPYNKQLLRNAKDEALKKQYQFVWWKNKVLVRKSPNHPAVEIKSIEDLEKLPFNPPMKYGQQSSQLPPLNEEVTTQNRRQ